LINSEPTTIILEMSEEEQTPREEAMEAMEAMEEENTTKEVDNVPWAWFKKMQHIVEAPPTADVAAQVRLPLEILPWLYISDVSSLRDTKRLVEMGITHVLSVNAMHSTQLAHLSDQLRTKQIVHQYVPGLDEYGYDMIGQHWAECHQFLESVFIQYKAKNVSPKKVVVHCMAGINRSGLIVAAAHMVFTRSPVLEVVRNLVHQRGEVLWNRSFQMQLCVLAAREGLLGERPVGYSNDPSTDDDHRPTEDDDENKVVESIVRSLVKLRSRRQAGTESCADGRTGQTPSEKA
jgi:protein-tyrosine phosphatase